MSANALIFDLDDTLINTKLRHYTIVNDFLQLHGKSIAVDNYLNLRRQQLLTNKQIVQNELGGYETAFTAFWKLNIEGGEYFKYDVEIVDPVLLAGIKQKTGNQLILLSLRSNSVTALAQVKQYSFFPLLDSCSFVSHAAVNPKIEKLAYFKTLYQQIVFVSDSQDDCKAAKTAGVEFAGVDTGLYPLHCDALFNDINSFLLKHFYE